MINDGPSTTHRNHSHKLRWLSAAAYPQNVCQNPDSKNNAEEQGIDQVDRWGIAVAEGEEVVFPQIFSNR